MLGTSKLTPDEVKDLSIEVANAFSAIGRLASEIAKDQSVLLNPMWKHANEDGYAVTHPDQVSVFGVAKYVDPDMTVAQFIVALANAFQRWPQLMLDCNESKRWLFGKSVKDNLFANGKGEWEKYVDSMKNRISWIGNVSPNP